MVSRFSWLRSLVFAVIFTMTVAPTTLAGSEDYHFDVKSDVLANCGDFTPDDVDLDRWYDDGELYVEISFEITEEQHETLSCAGTHFNLEVELSDFEELDDCSLRTSLEYTLDESIVTNGNGSATALIQGAKIADKEPDGYNRLPAGTDVWVEIYCDDVAVDDRDDPSVSASYTGSWWSPTENGGDNCHPTELENKHDEPVCVQYGSTAPMTGEDGEIYFPILFTIDE